MRLAYADSCVYIKEALSGVRTIAGVPVLITAFVGRVLHRSNDRLIRRQSFVKADLKFSLAQRSIGSQRGCIDAFPMRPCRRLSSNDRLLTDGYECLHTGTG